MIDADTNKHGDRESDRLGGEVSPVVCTVGGVMASEVTVGLALHRAHEGAVTTRSGGEYVTAGRPVAGFLTTAFDDLISSGLPALGRPDAFGWQPVRVTHTGQARYAQLHRLAVRTGMVADDYR